MTEENPTGTVEPGEGDGDKVEISREEYTKLVEKVAVSEQDKVNLVEEIKDIRTKKQEAEDKLKEALEKPAEPASTPVEGELISTEQIAEAATKAAQAAVAESKKLELETLKENTIVEFRASNPDFEEDNDLGGIKYAEFEKKLAMFNMGTAKTKEDILIVLNSAYNLLPKPTETTVENQTPPSSTPSNTGGSGPTSTDSDNLSAKELKIINDTFDGDKERYLKQKAKRPDYVAELLEWAK